MPLQPNKHIGSAWRYVPLGGTYALALIILGGTILYGTHGLRAKARQQITDQHARVLYAVWLSKNVADDSEEPLLANETPSDQLPALLQTARLQLPQLAGLLGTRLFDANGNFVFADPDIAESTLAPADLNDLQHLVPVARFHASADLGQVLLAPPPDSPPAGPLLEVSIPLHAPHREELIGIAQFVLDGKHVASEFRSLDQSLVQQALLTFLAGGGLLGMVLALGFRQLQRVNGLLRERTQSLLKANQELALAAKTSAVGAVTAHLIHGLKNPLSGLQTFMASRGGLSNEGPDSDWELAVSSTRRMQSMITEIVRVLRDEEAHAEYEISLEEFAQLLKARVQPLTREAGVAFECRVEAQSMLQNREANLISLVLYNLVQNAIQATPSGKRVSLSFSMIDDKILCTVADEGPGIPPRMQAALFQPCRSSKQGGSGIGLAISKQLANCLGAKLELQESSEQGSVFILAFKPNRPYEQGQYVEGTAARK